jgi:hypothetical protein
MAIADQWPQPIEILQYYKQSQEAIATLKDALLPSLGSAPAGAASQFFGMQPHEVSEALGQLARELDHEVVLLLTASFEATFQVDFHRRRSRKNKDRLSRKLRKLKPGRKQTNWITIEQILDVWQSETGHRRVICALKQLVLFRHWLAHGRYWNQKSGIDPDPLDAWQVGRRVFDVLPDFAPLPPASHH